MAPITMKKNSISYENRNNAVTKSVTGDDEAKKTCEHSDAEAACDEQSNCKCNGFFTGKFCGMYYLIKVFSFISQ